MRLGPGYRFTTRVLAGGPPVDGVLARRSGDWLVEAIRICRREFCRTRATQLTDNPLQKVEDLADQIVARGVRVVDGNVLGDDTAYPLGSLSAGLGRR